MPKPLAPVGGRPFLDILLDYLGKWQFIGKVVLAVGYMSEKIIREYAERGVEFSVEEELLGTGGAIKKALKQTETENVLVLNGDSFVEADLRDLMEKHIAYGASMTIVLAEVKDSGRYGLVRVDDDNRVVSFEEKGMGRGGHVNAGMYVFRRGLFDDVSEGRAISLETELLPRFLDKGVYGYPCSGKFIDIGIPETYGIAESYLKEANS